jgi:succinate dehydrogenase flavin-adding protein (antitoxin of CptAB toxin-antitoxin module)
MTTFTTEDRKLAEMQQEIIRNKSPCDDCNRAKECKEYELACRSFAKFVVDNFYYVEAVKDPCRATFNKIFNQKDDDLLRLFVRQFKGDADGHKTEDN